jgi:two-component system copper resistance phosphate regulon response regulator CusR
MLGKGLREQAYAVDVARQRPRGARTGERQRYDLIILDLGLPDGDGLTLCPETAIGRYAGRPSSFSRRDATRARIAGLDSGADDYLLKPFDLGELLARLRALATPREPAAATRTPRGRRSRTRYALAGGVLQRHAAAAHDPGVRAARVHGPARGQVITRGDIAEHVWDNSYDPLSNVIDVYVRRLRAKLTP